MCAGIGREESSPLLGILSVSNLFFWVCLLIPSGLVEWAEYLLGVVSEGRRGGRETTHSVVAGVRGSSRALVSGCPPGEFVELFRSAQPGMSASLDRRGER